MNCSGPTPALMVPYRQKKNVRKRVTVIIIIIIIITEGGALGDRLCGL